MNPSAQNQLHKMQRAILLGFLAIALSLVFWAVVRSEAILARDDNPRLVEAELRIQRGRILDRNGTVLAETIGEPDALIRSYPFPTIGPAVGYYSFRHGTAGIEAGFEAVLRGEDDEEITAVLNQGDPIKLAQVWQRLICAAIVYHHYLGVPVNVGMQLNGFQASASVIQAIPGKNDDGGRRPFLTHVLMGLCQATPVWLPAVLLFLAKLRVRQPVLDLRLKHLPDFGPDE